MNVWFGKVFHFRHFKKEPDAVITKERRRGCGSGCWVHLLLPAVSGVRVPMSPHTSTGQEDVLLARSIPQHEPSNGLFRADRV